MPIIPKAKASSQLRTSGASISPSAAGAVGQALAGLGNTAAGIGLHAMEKKKQADDVAFVSEQTNRLLREEAEKLADIETRGADVNLESIGQEYQDRLATILEGAPSEEAANEVKRQADSFYSRKFFPQYSKHQSSINVKKRVNSSSNALDDINSEVLTGRTSVSEALARSEAVITGLSETAGGVVDIDKLRQSQRNSIGVSHLTSRIEAGEGRKVIQEIEDGKWDSFTDTSQLGALHRQAIKQVNEAEAAAQARRDKQNALVASDLEINVSRNNATYSDIDKALSDGVISPSKRTQLYKTLDSNAEKANNDADDLTRVQTSISLGIPLDPTSNKDKAGVDKLWASMVPDLNTRDPNEFANSAVSFVQSTGILPSQLKGNIAAFARSGDNEQAAMAADLVGRLQAVNSPALNDLTKESYGFGLSVTSMVESGVDKQKAVEIARKSAFGQNEQTKKTTNAIIKSSSDDNVSFLNDKLDVFDSGAFSSQPEITPALQAEFEVLLGEMLPYTNNDIEAARSMAWTSMRNVWGATMVNGSAQVMKYAPESIYGNGVGSEWISEQFNQEMEKFGAKDAFIAVDIKTARSSEPSYPVFTRDENGGISPLLDEDNLPLRWKPEFRSSPEYKELEEAQNEQIRKAKHRRLIIDQKTAYRQERLERISAEQDSFFKKKAGK